MTWVFSSSLIAAFESSRFSQALAAESLVGNYWDGEQSAPLSVMPTAQPFWRNDKPMDVLSRSPFGLTWKPLTDTRGEELLTWFRAGFPARTSVPPVRGGGIYAERSGLWSHMAGIIGEVRPRKVYVENSPLLVGRGLARVLSDLAEMGFDAQWGVVGAHHLGAPHKRDRIWIVGDANVIGCESRRENHAGNDRHFAQSANKDAEPVADPEGQRCREAL